jgi:CelD/BcsL family acetyltransferase involved in cellulose biosynthesis
MTTVESRADARVASSMVAAAHRGGVEVVERWADEWRNLCSQSTNDQPFYRPEWIAAHIRAFAPQAKVFLLTVKSDEKLLFILPLLEELSLFSGVPVRKLRAPVNSHSCRFDAVRLAGSQGDAAVVAAWDHLQNLRGWDVLEITDVLEGSTVSVLAVAARQRGFHAVELPNLTNPYVPIPPNPADLKKLPINARLRGKLRHIRREVDSQGQLKFLRIDHADQAALDRFYQLESAGWKGREGSAIACSPKTRQFYDEVSRSAEQFGYLCIYTLELNGELLAAHLGLSHRTRYFSPKVAYNETLPQYAGGHLIVSEILQECSARGITEYDITGVNDDWKMKWASEARPKFIYFIFRRGLPGSLAHALRFRLRPAVKKLVKPLRRVSEGTNEVDPHC